MILDTMFSLNRYLSRMCYLWSYARFKSHLRAFLYNRSSPFLSCQYGGVSPLTKMMSTSAKAEVALYYIGM